MTWPILMLALLAALHPVLLRAQPEPRARNPLALREEQICLAFGYSPGDPRWSDCREAARRHADDLPGRVDDLQAIARYCDYTRRGLLSPGFAECLLAWDERRILCDRPEFGTAPEVLEMRRRFCGLWGEAPE